MTEIVGNSDFHDRRTYSHHHILFTSPYLAWLARYSRKNKLQPLFIDSSCIFPFEGVGWLKSGRLFLGNGSATVITHFDRSASTNLQYFDHCQWILLSLRSQQVIPWYIWCLEPEGRLRFSKIPHILNNNCVIGRLWERQMACHVAFTVNIVGVLFGCWSSGHSILFKCDNLSIDFWDCHGFWASSWYFDGTIILLMTLMDCHCWKLAACFVHNTFYSTQLCTHVWMVHQQTHHVTDMDRQPPGIRGPGIMQTSMVRCVPGIANTAAQSCFPGVI